MNGVASPRIAVICIGSELLRGTVLNRNAHFIHRELTAAGFQVKSSSIVADAPEEMYHEFRERFQNYDVVITTGGLGPTGDDRTLATLARFFQTELIDDPEQRQRVEEFFQRRGREMTVSNLTQVKRLAAGSLLPNRLGTAPGQVVEREEKLWFSLPGVPFEMEAMLREQVLPLLTARWPLSPPALLRLRLVGITESALYDLLRSRLEPETLAEISFLPSLLGHLLELPLPEPEPAAALLELLREYLVSTSGKTLPEAIIENLARNGCTLATAESCTGGGVGQLLTTVPGASAVYLGGVIVYSDAQKTARLQVPATMLLEHGAVSEPVVEVMAARVREQFGADFGLAVSGIAGPDGGSETKPVGTVWHALASPEGVRCSLRRFGDRLLGGEREANRQQAAATLLTMLFHHLRTDGRWEAA